MDDASGDERADGQRGSAQALQHAPFAREGHRHGDVRVGGRDQPEDRHRDDVVRRSVEGDAAAVDRSVAEKGREDDEQPEREDEGEDRGSRVAHEREVHEPQVRHDPASLTHLRGRLRLR